MSKITFHSTMDEGLLLLAKQQAEEEGLNGVNTFFEGSVNNSVYGACPNPS